jgi:hypothetical protein
MLRGGISMLLRGGRRQRRAANKPFIAEKKWDPGKKGYGGEIFDDLKSKRNWMEKVDNKNIMKVMPQVQLPPEVEEKILKEADNVIETRKASGGPINQKTVLGDMGHYIEKEMLEQVPYIRYKDIKVRTSDGTEVPLQLDGLTADGRTPTSVKTSAKKEDYGNTLDTFRRLVEHAHAGGTVYTQGKPNHELTEILRQVYKAMENGELDGGLAVNIITLDGTPQGKALKDKIIAKAEKFNQERIPKGKSKQGSTDIIRVKEA